MGILSRERGVFDDRQAPDEFLRVELEGVIVAVGGGDGKTDDFGGAELMGPDEIDLCYGDPAGRRSFKMFEPDRSGISRLEYGRDAKLSGEFPILDDGCHCGDYG
jgi:hypothetical protein